MFRAGFAIEQTLGHVTFGQNLRRLLADEPDLETSWLDVPFRPQSLAYRMPPASINWSLRGSLYARQQLLSSEWRNVDCAFVHTLTISLLATPFYERVPTVLSTDATPINLDSIASGYGHRRQPEIIERTKLALTRRALRQARAYVAWSEWAKRSLVDDYGVPEDKVLVAAPGTDVDLYERACVRRDGPPRILFVGGDFLRKGGDLLLEAFQTRLRGKAELHLVTGYPVPEQEGVFQYAGLPPNSEPLLDLYRQADIFALPTRADCLAVVLGEAMAASLPIVTTDVGAHGEAVQDTHNGFLIPRDDAAALGDALERLVDDPGLRETMGQRARCLAETHFDAAKNARKVVQHMQMAAEGF
jgi:glycosyltransferase involved in cell wall biosynthesis